MNKTNTRKNKNRLFVASITIVVALALIASPIVAMEDAFATKKKKGGCSGCGGSWGTIFSGPLIGTLAVGQ